LGIAKLVREPDRGPDEALRLAVDHLRYRTFGGARMPTGATEGRRIGRAGPYDMPDLRLGAAFLVCHNRDARKPCHAAPDLWWGEAPERPNGFRRGVRLPYKRV